MKTIQIVPAEVIVNQTVIGIATSVTVGGNCEMFATSVNVWTNLLSDTSMSLVTKNINVTAGCSEQGVDWDVVLQDALNQIGVTPAPVV